MKVDEYKKLVGKPRKKMQQEEYKLHVDFVNHMRTAFPQVLFTHAGKGKGKADGMFKKRMGYRAGTPDLIMWWKVEPSILNKLWSLLGFSVNLIHSGGIEFKAAKGSMSDGQDSFESIFTQYGGNYALCYSKRDAHKALCSWGLVPVHGCGAEVDLRTQQEKVRDSIAAFAPLKKG